MSRSTPVGVKVTAKCWVDGRSTAHPLTLLLLWSVHHTYAPGYYTGYGVKTLPGVREEIEQRDFVEAQQQIDRLGEVLMTYASQMRKIIGIVAKK